MNRTLLLALAAAALILVAVLLLQRAPPAATGSATTTSTTTTTSKTPPPPAARDAATTPVATPAARDAAVASTARVVLRAAWGSGPGQLGRRADPESAAVGPMSFFVDRHGVTVLDNVNRRIARFDARGRPLPPIALPDEAAQDVVRGAGDRVAVLERLRDPRVMLYDADGRALGSVPLAGPGIDDPGGVTGLFTDRGGNLYVEREHGAWLELADAEGRAVASRPRAPGRPLPDGRFVTGAIADRAAGTARVRVLDGDGNPAWEAAVSFGAPLMFLALLDGDSAGDVFVGAHVGHESPAPPYRIEDEALVLVALGPDGRERARLTLPAPPPAEESFRDLSVGDDGTIYWMRRTASGVVIEAYRL